MGLEKIGWLRAGNIARRRLRHERREGALEGIEHVGYAKSSKMPIRNPVERIKHNLGRLVPHEALSRGASRALNIGGRLESAEKFRKRKGDLDLGF